MSGTAINAQEQERFVNDMARYAKTHADWKNFQPEAAVRSILWVLVSDKTAFDDLCRVWAAEEGAGSPRRCDRCDGTDFLSSALNANDEPVWLCRDCVSSLTGSEATSHAEDHVVDRMATVEQSIAEAKAACIAHRNGREEQP